MSDLRPDIRVPSQLWGSPSLQIWGKEIVILLGFSCFMNRQRLSSVWRNQIVCFCLYLLQSSSNRRTPKFTRELLELGLFGFDTPQYYSHVNILLHLHRTIFSRTLTGYLKAHFMIMITMKTDLWLEKCS